MLYSRMNVVGDENYPNSVSVSCDIEYYAVDSLREV